MQNPKTSFLEMNEYMHSVPDFAEDHTLGWINWPRLYVFGKII
jgi:hypothetical protein